MRKNVSAYIMVTIILILCLLSLPLILIMPRVMFNLSLNDLENESDRVPAHVVYGVLHTEEGRVPVSQILRKQSKNYTLKEIFCIANNQAYFCYRDSTETDIWRLASIDLYTKGISDYIQFDVSETKYATNFSGNYNEKCGYYDDGRIILSDMNHVLTFDIKNCSYTVTDYSEYSFPQHSEAEDSLLSSFPLSELAEQSESFARIYALDSRRTWDGTSRLSGFFKESNIFVIGEGKYTIQPVLNYAGETHMLIFEYNDNGTWLFVSKCFVGDIFRDECYIIPMLT